MADVLPASHHAVCLFHIEKIVISRFKTNMNGLLWKAAASLTAEEFDGCIGAMRKLSEGAAEYVAAIPLDRWVRGFFPGRRFGHLTSNVAESTNAWRDDVRKLKPTGMFAEFVRKVNVLFHTRRTQYAKMDPDFLPKTVADTFDRSIEAGRRIGVVRNSESVFEVQRLSNGNAYRVVNLATISCTCGVPQEERIPCPHLCAASLFIKQDPIQFVLRERFVSSIRPVYSETTTPIDINCQTTGRSHRCTVVVGEDHQQGEFVLCSGDTHTKLPCQSALGRRQTPATPKPSRDIQPFFLF